MSIRKFWPTDRLKQFDALKAEAVKRGMALSARNYGARLAPVYRLTFTKDGAIVTWFFDIKKAQEWLAAEGTRQGAESRKRRTRSGRPSKRQRMAAAQRIDATIQ